MAYTVPSLLISQEFNATPVFSANPLPALIMGPFLPPPGYIKSIAVGTAGAGYLSAPAVTIVDALGVGTGATATSTINSSGQVSAINILTGGIGYTTGNTTIAIGAPPNTATGYVTLNSAGNLGSVIITNAGAGYGSAPTITINSAPGSGSGESLTAVLTGGIVSSVTVTAGSAVYTTPPTITFTSPGSETQAVAGSVVYETTNTLTARTEQWVPAPYTSTSAYIPFIGTVTQISDVIAAFGDITYQNTIAYGLVQALNNSNGVPVYYGVTTPTSITTEEAAYDALLTVAAKGNTYYGLVPLTFSQSVQEDIAGHVNSMSSPQNAKWRTAWFCNSSTGTALSSLSPSSFTGSQTEINTYLSSIEASGANAISSANPNSGLRRIHNVFPTIYTDANGITNQAGYFLAAGLAGLRSGSVPHQSLTNTQLIGPVSVPVVTNVYSQTALNQLAAAGVWIITQSPNGGVCYTRHQLSGDSSSLNYREDSVTANVDSISYGLQNALAPFVGIYNISPGVLLQIQSVLDAELSFYLTGTYTPRAGNQLLGYKILSIAQDPVFVDTLDITIQLQVPYPMNYINVTLSI